MDRNAPDREGTCAEVRDLLTALEGDLDSCQQETLERHVRSCAGCRRALEEHRAAWSLLASASPPAPRLSDGEFLASVRGRIRRGAVIRRLAAVAAAAVLACAGLFWVSRPAGEDLAVIENIEVLQAIEAIQDDVPADAADLGRILVGMLEEEEEDEQVGPADAPEESIPDDLDALLDALGKDSGRQG